MGRSIPFLLSRCFNRRFVSFPIIVDTPPVFGALVDFAQEARALNALHAEITEIGLSASATTAACRQIFIWGWR
ncbi:Uncharacterised protein [BD1-7 clade bacterium]|nr:Uncharacterised protein [BD1-7 clade bacterium]